MSVKYFCDRCSEEITKGAELCTIKIQHPLAKSAVNLHLHVQCYCNDLDPLIRTRVQKKIPSDKLVVPNQKEEASTVVSENSTTKKTTDKKDTVVKEAVKDVAAIAEKPVYVAKPAKEVLKEVVDTVEEPKKIEGKRTRGKTVKDIHYSIDNPHDNIVVTNAACDFDLPRSRNKYILSELSSDINRFIYISANKQETARRYGIPISAVYNYEVRFFANHVDFVPESRVDCEQFLESNKSFLKDIIKVMRKATWSVASLAEDFGISEDDVIFLWENIPWFHDTL